MAQGKVFIPPAISSFASITISGTKYPDLNGMTFPVELDPTWYLFWSRKIGADSSLLGGDTFAIDQNILSNYEMQPGAPIPTMTDWAVDQNTFSVTEFQTRAPVVSMTQWAIDQNILASFEFNPYVRTPITPHTDPQYVLSAFEFGD